MFAKLSPTLWIVVILVLVITPLSSSSIPRPLTPLSFITDVILLDTAAVYRNEKDIGEALRMKGAKREELFITSKIPPASLSYEGAMKSCLSSLSDLQTDYVGILHLPSPLSPYSHSLSGFL